MEFSGQFCRAVATATVLLAASSSIASADMGTAPVSNGLYGGLEGGYLHQDIDDVNGFGIGSGREAFISPENGWFAGGMIGYARPNTNIMGMPVSRIEGYIHFGRTDDDISASAPPAADLTLKTVDGAVLVVGGSQARTSVERRTIEGGLRFERDEFGYEGGSIKDEPVRSNRNLTRVIQPFIRFMEEETETVVSGCCDAYRSASVDNHMYGVLAALEPEYWHTPRVALVGRVGVGVYGYHVEGDFASSSQSFATPDPFAASVSDDDSGVGFRGSLGAALKFKLSEKALLETFAEADYFSHVGRASFADANPATSAASRVDVDDMWELRAGVRFTLGFGERSN